MLPESVAMANESTPGSVERLTLRSELPELARVLPWVEALAVQYAIPERTVFAIDLCLEEVLSNIIRHGYRSDPGQSIRIEFRSTGEGRFVFIVEDSASHFRPFDSAVPPASPVPATLEDLTPGGLGIPLLRNFADAVEWEPLEKGNRLTLRFSVQR